MLHIFLGICTPFLSHSVCFNYSSNYTFTLCLDDAESPAGGRRPGPSGKCEPNGGHLFKVPAPEP